MMKITKSQLKEMVKEVLKEQATLPPPKNPAQSFKMPVSKSGSIEITDGENLTSNEKSALDKMSTTLINNVTTKKSALKLLTILQKSIEEGFFDKKLKESNGASRTVSESKENIPHYKEFEKKFEKLTKQDIENIAKFHRNSLRSLVNNLAWYYSDLLYSSNSLALEFDDPIDLYETIEALLSAPPVDSIYDTPKWNRVSGVVDEFDRKFGGYDNAKAIDEYAKQLGKDLLQVVNQFSNK